ncbi:MAG: PEP-CTERM sorting domain-containing protein [Burkholderiales bacterium]|nr:PEP-CTERM sorting domain-containing protein [Burkholderiales bacterium]
MGAASMGAHAATLIVDLEGRVTAFNSPPEFADLGTAALSQTFWGTIVIPDFENYLTGTYTFALNSVGTPEAESDVLFSLFTPLLTGIEGTRTRGQPGVTPDNTTLGEGSFTLTDGRISGFSYSIDRDQGLATYDRFIRDLEVPVLLDTITVAGGTFSTARELIAGSGVYYATSVSSTATINVISSAPVPEPETYVMMGAGLALIGALAARRKRAAATV